MIKQNQIKRVLAQPDSVVTVQQFVASGARNRSALAEAVCEHFGFLNPQGRAQTSGCLKALRDMAGSGQDPQSP